VSIRARRRGRSHIAAADVTMGIRITDELGDEIYGVNTRLLDLVVALDAGQTFDLTFTFDMRLAPGRYRITAAIHAAEDHYHKCYHWIDNAAAFECQWRGRAGFSGLVNLRATASLHCSFSLK
jgi:lipopolysaccharide transport system ATP-binding protein